jgi:hypothetical protein
VGLTKKNEATDGGMSMKSESERLIKELQRSSEERAYGKEEDDRLARLLNDAANTIKRLEARIEYLIRHIRDRSWETSPDRMGS